MALVHHALVQFSHWRVTKPSGCEPTWFGTYLVLGDDVDIAKNGEVADSYQRTCANLTIIIGLIKSLRSNTNCFEFANRRFSPDGDISPLSLKEELASNSWIARLEYAKRILVRFGTSYSDRGLALLRKATTVRQWDVLIPELSGARGDTSYLNAVRFLLENPFTQNELKDLPVERILSWLTLLLPEGDRKRLSNYSSDPSNIAGFSAMFASKLVTLLDMEIQKVLKGIPSRNLLGTLKQKDIWKDPKGDVDLTQQMLERADVSKVSYSLKEDRMRATYHLSTMLPKRISDLVEKLSSLNAPQTVTYPQGQGTYVFGDGSPENYDASVTLIYNQWCFAAHNERLLEDLEGLKRKIVILKAYLRGETPLASELLAADSYIKEDSDFEANTFVGAAIEVWSEFTALPQVILPDFSSSINKWLPQAEEGPIPYIEILHRLPSGKMSVEKILQLAEERTRGPLRALGFALAKEFGLILPTLHDMAFEKAPMKGDSWLTLARKWRKEGNISRLIAGTSANLVEQGELLTRKIRKASFYWHPIFVEGSSVWERSPIEGSHGESSEIEEALDYDAVPTLALYRSS
jgi:hypothetical protein